MTSGNRTTAEVKRQANKPIETKGEKRWSREKLFTLRFCEKLRERRRELGLSYAQLGFFLGVNWSTVRKWEQGGVMACNARVRPALLAFLSGKSDETVLLVLRQRREQKQKREYPNWAYSYFARVRMTFDLCHQKPDLQRQMIRTIDEKIFRLIGDFAMQGNLHDGCGSSKESEV